MGEPGDDGLGDTAVMPGGDDAYEVRFCDGGYYGSMAVLREGENETAKCGCRIEVDDRVSSLSESRDVGPADAKWGQ